MGWPLVRSVFYLPQPDIGVTYDGKVEQLVESPDKIEFFPLDCKMPSPFPPSIDSLENWRGWPSRQPSKNKKTQTSIAVP
jgi:hypothetical protein